MRRRSFLAASAAAATGGLAGCVQLAPPAAGPASVPDMLRAAPVLPLNAPLAPVRSSMDRVTRSLVGLRPFRKPGPRLETVKLGDKTLVHNYGHGGGGVSLSWGVAEMAAAMIKSTGERNIAVLGSGVIGLSTALELQRVGAEVTIYAAEFPPYTTSNVAGAMWHPVTLFERGYESPDMMKMLHLAARIAFLRFIRYANDSDYGVYWIRQYSLRNRPANAAVPYIGGDDLYPGLVRNQTENSPFGTPYWDGYYTLMIDPDIYLRSLVRDFRIAGGRMQQYQFGSEADLMSLAQTSIVNCMGLGSGKVFGDEEIIPARGQLSFLLPQSDIDYGYAGGFGDHGTLYTFPRKTGILLGGSVGKGDWNTDVDAAEVTRMVNGHAALAARLQA